MCVCVCVCVCVICVCQAHVEELPAKKAAMEDLNSRHKQITLPADRQKDIRIINGRWAQVSGPATASDAANSTPALCKQSFIFTRQNKAVSGYKLAQCIS